MLIEKLAYYVGRIISGLYKPALSKPRVKLYKLDTGSAVFNVRQLGWPRKNLENLEKKLAGGELEAFLGADCEIYIMDKERLIHKVMKFTDVEQNSCANHILKI